MPASTARNRGKGLKGEGADAVAGTPVAARGTVEGKLQSAARGASYNVVLQLLLRIATFAVNAIVVRKTSAAMLGVVNVRLTILYQTVLFVVRRPFASLEVGLARGMMEEHACCDQQHIALLPAHLSSGFLPASPDC
jgi:hypothetical protein